MALKKLRKKLDAIDGQLLELLNKRAQEVIKISKVKQEKNLEAYSASREAEIFSRLKRSNVGPLGNEDVETVFREVVSVCRSLRVGLKIGYLGPQGTFTHLAAIKKFGKKPEFVPAESINEVFDKVSQGVVDYGVVPIENSIEGVVNYTLDMFFVSPLKICSEVTLTISHCLLGVESRTIKRIYSHPHVFPQSRRWLARNYAHVELIPVSSTAAAAMAVKKDRNGACIGNKILASLYNLKVISSSIEDSNVNFTRFLVIGKNDSPASAKSKTSILFAIKDRVGALYDVLSSFKRHGINLTKIESRPSKRKAWEYYFFVDFLGHRTSPAVQKALKGLEKGCQFVKILGSYPT